MNRNEVYRPVCAACGTRINKPEPGQLMHGWCAMMQAGVARAQSAPPTPTASDVAVEAAPARWPAESERAAMPIRNVEATPMPRPAKTVPAVPSAPTLDQVAAVGAEYEALKAEAERIALLVERKAAFLRDALPAFGGRVQVGERALALVECVRETFDLEAAKQKRGMKTLLKPYIETVEKLDLKAARKHIGDETLDPFVTATETVQLRFLKLKPGAGEGDA